MDNPTTASTLDYVVVLARITLGLLLLITAGAKVRDPKRFAADVERYELLPAPRLSVPIAVASVLLAEFVLGTLLTIGWFTRLAALGAALMFVLFFGAVSSALASKKSIDCGCWNGPSQVSTQHLLFLGAAIAASILIATTTPIIYGVDAAQASVQMNVQPPVALAVIATAMGVVILAAISSQLLRMRRLGMPFPEEAHLEADEAAHPMHPIQLKGATHDDST